MRLKVNGERIDTSPENTVLFQYAGELSMYNFVYVDSDTSYARVFETSASGDLYKKLAKEAIDGKYPTHQNLTGILEDDRKAYEQMALKDVARLNTVPIEWQRAY